MIMKERVDDASDYRCTKSAILVEDADRERAHIYAKGESDGE